MGVRETGPPVPAGKIFPERRRMRDWRHECSMQWLVARSLFLTASDIRDLVTDTRRILAGKISVEEAQQYAKVYGRKRVNDLDPMSVGAMARGHIMEPFAIEEYRRETGDEAMEFWDDRIVFDHDVAFSPDGLDIKMPRDVSVPAASIKPTAMVEVKSYAAGQHYQRLAAIGSGIPLEERWQIAMGMYVCDAIDKGSLVLYAPQCNSMVIKTYVREALEEELDFIDQLVAEWRKFNDYMADVQKDGYLCHGTEMNEGAVYNEYMKLAV